MRARGWTKSDWYEGVICLIAVATVGYLGWQWFSGPPKGRGQLVTDVSGVTLEASELGHVQGKAPVVLLEFADYQCPFCVSFIRSYESALRDELIKPGVAEFAYLHFPLAAIHPLATLASVAAECSGRQGKFWEMHHTLFEQSPRLGRSQLLTYARDLGVREGAFATCLDDGDVTTGIDTMTERGRRLGVRGTPAFFIGDRDASGRVNIRKRISGAVPFRVIKDAVFERYEALTASVKSQAQAR